jgi:hypothetical protein
MSDLQPTYEAFDGVDIHMAKDEDGWFADIGGQIYEGKDPVEALRKLADAIEQQRPKSTE